MKKLRLVKFAFQCGEAKHFDYFWLKLTYFAGLPRLAGLLNFQISSATGSVKYLHNTSYLAVSLISHSQKILTSMEMDTYSMSLGHIL